MARLRRGGGRHAISAFNALSGEFVWRFRTSKMADLFVFALDARTGGVTWARRLGRGPLP